ncbi:MAG: hypothetical protein AAFY35_12835 [Pseudomonadota bacterium]
MSETTVSVDHLRHAIAQAQGRQHADLPGFAGSVILRGFAFCAGLAFFVTSVGLWAFTSPDASVMLIKLGASIVFLGGAAIFLLIAIAPHDFYRLEFDRARQELRVLERDECGRFFVQSTQRLSELAKLRFEGGALRAWNEEGAMVMSVPMRARHARAILRGVLAA